MDCFALLKNNGLKATSQRLCILQNLYEKGHATLEELYEAAKPTYPTLSLATIYRNINEMMRRKVITDVKLPKKKHRYEIVKEPHLHLHCSSCGTIEDAIVDVKPLSNKIESEYGCVVLEDMIVLNVVCKKCKNSR